MLFIWMENKKDFPWFIIPFFISVGFFLIHFCFTYYHNNSFVLHLAFFGYSNTLIFVVWILQYGGHFPWFIFPLAAGVFLIFIHYQLMRKNSSYAEIRSSWVPNVSPVSDLEHNSPPPSYHYPNPNVYPPTNEPHSVLPNHMKSDDPSIHIHHETTTPHPTPVYQEYQNPYGGYQNSSVIPPSAPIVEEPSNEGNENNQGYTSL
eukprot:TRINITY_DN4125_c0_g1_i1.p1 TRINITY_DN4125_c0_g1~~TRINITY_DN4125_c0_g1_i1.p1  ORF type:complete len:204 (+),score=84.91 TRINITY_DN4125_c0_g1_i1:782-1393(+)